MTALSAQRTKNIENKDNKTVYELVTYLLYTHLLKSSRKDYIMNENLLKIEYVAVAIDVSVQTINNWYRFKRLEPDNEYAKILPDYIQKGPRRTRFWKKSDMEQLVKFKESIPHGVSGIMGEVTHVERRRKNAKAKI